MKAKGRVFKYGDNVDTDVIIPARYLAIADKKELAEHLKELWEGTEETDENGCCPGEKYVDMGELGFNCCPEAGGDCFPPMKKEMSPEDIAKNIEAGLCADGSQPNKFGCCGEEVFKDMGNTVFACCPKNGEGDCFPPIKK